LHRALTALRSAWSDPNAMANTMRAEKLYTQIDNIKTGQERCCLFGNKITKTQGGISITLYEHYNFSPQRPQRCAEII